MISKNFLTTHREVYSLQKQAAVDSTPADFVRAVVSISVVVVRRGHAIFIDTHRYHLGTILARNLVRLI